MSRRLRGDALIVLLLVLAACSSTSTPPAAMPRSTATCSDLACLQANEGMVIDVAGTFAFPPEGAPRGRHFQRLTLGDGTSVVLHPEHAKLTRAIDGKQITARGIYYKHPIPERYGIIQAIADPYLVEIYDVTMR
jgi:hypothetical protein